MIPILYEENTTSFTGNGIGRLSDCISCVVEEKESGVFECKLKYPISGIHYSDIQENRIVYCIHDDAKNPQPFKIYGRSAPINGVVDFYAHHISYDLGNVVLEPFTSTTCTETFVQLKNKEIEASPFSFWTDKASTGNFEIKVPTVTRSILGGVEGSVLDVFGGGDYEWDGYTVKLWNDRGQDNNVNIRYGVNLIDLMHETDYSSAFNAVVPFWYHEGSGTDDPTALVMLEDKIVRAEGTEEQELRLTALDLSMQFETEPTEEQLRAYTVNYLANNKPWRIDESITVNFVALWQTEDYKNVAPLQRVNLYDYVHVVYEELGVNKKMQVVETVYDVLNERYNKIELGVSKQSFAEVINAITDATIKKEAVSKSYVDASIARTAETIKGNRGGYKYEVTDADGHIMETLYMDSPNIETAVNILRIGQSGIAFSNHGYDPESFVTAWTIDGEFNANFIAAGEINAGLIRGGTLTLGGSNNDNGMLVVYDASGNEISRFDNSGLMQNKYSIYNYLGTAFTLTIQLVSGTINITDKNGMSVNYGETPKNTSSFSIMPSSNQLDTMKYGLIKIRDVEGIGLLSSTSSAKFIITKEKTVNGLDEQYWFFSQNSAFYNDYLTFKITNTGIVGFSDDGFTNAPSNYSTFSCSHMYVNPVDSIVSLYARNNTSQYSAYLYMKATSGNTTISMIGASQISMQDTAKITMQGTSYITMQGSGYIDVRGGSIVSNSTWTQLARYDGTVFLSHSVSNSTTLIKFGTNNLSNSGDVALNWGSKSIAFNTSSSKRYKNNITEEIDEELDPHRLYELPMKQFKYNDDFDHLQFEDMRGQVLPGFIAEDVEEIYPSAVIHDGKGRVESWDERRIIPGMLALIQEQKQQLDEQEKRIAKLEEQIALLQEMVLHDRMKEKEGN